MISEPKTKTAANNGLANADAILAQLNRILNSAEFQKSDRLSNFLRYIVQETVAGREDHIKGYNIAVEVFKRSQDFDPIQDPIVRIEAGRLRRTLTNYYQEHGQQDPLRIEIPKGAYIPTFTDNNIEVDSPQTTTSLDTTNVKATHNKSAPSLVVLPIKYLSDESSYEYFASGLSEEITIALNCFKELHIISGSVIPESIANNPDIQQLGRQLNVRFVLTGSLRKSGNQIRVTMQLFDVRSSEQIWADKYNHELTAESLFTIQDAITQKVIIKVADRFNGVIPRTLTSESRSKTENLNSYEAILRMHHYLQTVTNDSYLQAREALETATNADNLNARVWAAYAEILGDGYAHNFFNQDRSESVRKSLQAAHRAIALDSNCDYAHWALGQTALIARDEYTVVHAAESLLDIQASPSFIALSGWLLALVGQWERGLEIQRKQFKIMKFYPGWFHHAFFLDYYRKGDYENALIEAKIFNIPNFYWDPIERAAAYGQLGRINEAKAALDELLAQRPDFADDPGRYLNCFIFQGELVDHVIEGLRKAGLKVT